MIIGHYAAALIPHERDPQTPLALYLFLANAADFLWLGAAAVGLEAPVPRSLFEASFANLHVAMPFTHDLVPTMGWAVLAAAVVYAATRRGAPAGWAAALVVAHEACDLLSGFSHWILGPATPAIGLNLYGRAPEVALLLEAAFGAGCTWWFVRARARAGRPLSGSTKWGLYATFVAGALVWLPIARTPLADWLR